jgi:hypothetical protein
MPIPATSRPRSNWLSTRCDNRQTHQHSGNLHSPPCNRGEWQLTGSRER